MQARRQPVSARSHGLELLALAPGERAAHGQLVPAVLTSRVNFSEDQMSLVSELWAFMKERKKWWLLPVIVVMLVVGTLLIFAQGSVLAPFIYTIF